MNKVKQKTQDVFIGIAAHKPIANISIPYHYIVCAGAEYNAEKFNGMKVLRDSGGEEKSISAKNPVYNELTVQYWMWKRNIDARYIGLCHYRRYWNFKCNSAIHYPRVSEPFLSRRIFKKYAWNREFLSKAFSEIDGLNEEVDMYWAKVESDVKPGISSIYENHTRIGNERSIDLLMKSIKMVSPKLLGVAKEYFNQRYKHMFNMFIMKKQLFEEYSKWLFEVLAVYQEIMTDTTGKVHERSCGFAGEHLLNIWGNYMIKYQNIKAVELQTVFINCTDINSKMTDRAKAVGKQLFGYIFPYGTQRRDWIKWNIVMRR